MSHFLKERLGRRNDSLEGRLYPIIRTMIDAQNSDEFDNNTIFNTVQSEMEGREIPGKSDMFYIDDLGMTVTRTKIMKVLREKFKAVNTRIILPDGTRQRGLKISSEVLERIRASYEDPWDIKILPIEDTSAQVNQPNQVLDQYGDQNDTQKQGIEAVNHEENEPEHRSDNPENMQKEASNSGENSVPASVDPGLPGFVGQSYSIEDIIASVMKDGQGNNQGYFTLHDWKFKLMMLPIQHPLHCDENQAEQIFYQILQERKIIEIEQGKYKPKM